MGISYNIPKLKIQKCLHRKRIFQKYEHQQKNAAHESIISYIIELISKRKSGTTVFFLVKQASHAQNSLKMMKPQDCNTQKLLHKETTQLFEGYAQKMERQIRSSITQ